MHKYIPKKRGVYPYLLLLPLLLALILIIFYPILYSVYLSFNHYVLTTPSEIGFSGIENYVKILGDEVFWRSLRRTGMWIFWTIGFELLFGLMIAWLLDRKFPGRGIVRSLVLLPWVFPSILTGLMWVWMLDDTYGIINDFLVKVRLIDSYIPWLSLAGTALYGIIAAQVWHGTPFFVIMILAAMQGIPKELYEAARIDGANKWQEYWYITWPHILPTVLITTLLRTIWTASYVEIIEIMTGGGPGESTLTLPVYAFRRAYSYLDFGYSAALSLALVGMLSGLVWAYLRMMKMSRVEIL